MLATVSDRQSSRDWDIIVVGCGAAGTATALSAVEAAKQQGIDAKVIILERGDETTWGGNSRYTHANFRMDDDEHVRPGLLAEMVRFSRGKSDEQHLSILARSAPDSVGWLKSNGVVFEKRPFRLNMMGAPTIGPAGGGLEIITKLRANAEALGVKVLLRTTAYGLLLSGDGFVVGLKVRDGDGMLRELSSGAVVLAGGGFEGNYEMLTQYMGKEAVNLRLEVPGTKLHQGECIRMALEAGAKTAGQFDGYHGNIVDPRSNSFVPAIAIYPYGILVNAHGQRFTDEGESLTMESFELISRAVSRQPGNKAHFITDAKLYDIDGYGRALKTDQPPIKAGSLPELARLIEVPEGHLVETVQAYNRSIQKGKFDPHHEDHKATAGVTPAKSNWAVEIDTPPFISYPMEGTIEFTWGGLATDTKARVLATNDAPIPGLYAVGEIVGLWYHRYPGATSVLRAVTFGRIAGKEALTFSRAGKP